MKLCRTQSFAALKDHQTWCMWVVCTCLLREGPVELILRLTCPSGHAPIGRRRAEPGVVTQVSTWWHCLPHWGPQCWWNRGENGFILLSCLWGREFMPTIPQDALTNEETIPFPFSPASIRSPPHPVCARAICLPDRTDLCFISSAAVFQNSKLQRHPAMRPCNDPLGEVLAALGPVLSQKIGLQWPSGLICCV